MMADGFTGFTEAALDFYDDLEVDNTKSFWEAHREQYQTAVRGPMVALTDALEPDFGAAKIFRPFRDVRFAKDKTPYKTHQGAFVAAGPACGWYIEIAARGFRTGAGFYDASAADLAEIRAAMADETKGTQLEKILAKLRRAGFEVGGDRLKTSPRGYDADHPRIDLLRHRSLTIGKHYGFEPIIYTPELVGVVRADWKATRPLVEWVCARLGH
ncbi:DUF2461 domain-containing protein [Mycolicibacterium arenosum]|uniref:DUF2461 domain-containing protein n=1 Tax=Mycolicibacterium arenosum TaxID=2952157 RepID=A0ABT1MC35_9MYCO|nr:DUF2461 domain-containing protein [Mycolicibacterium sp. CAU 1645]MCP9275759.1 DUF2461 domain-containing protein [Mycolicibacterium sp. CAU 1645]